MLAYLFANEESRLRADLQRYFHIDLDHAMRGHHSAHHIACLVEGLPHDARIFVGSDEDAAWGMADVLLASILNTLNGLVWGMGDPRKRGKRPDLVGPKRLTEKGKRSLPARAMDVDSLIEILSKPRR